MPKIDSFKISNNILILFVIILLIYSFDYSFGFYLNKFYPNYYLYTNGPKIGGIDSKVWMENGIIEVLQAIILLIAISNLFAILFKKKNIYNNLFFKLIVIKILLLIYFLGEEISWGQHFLYFETNEFFNKYNKQNETNLHNISNIFNEIPRSLVLFWTGLFIFIYKKFRFNTKLETFICPNNKLKKISIYILIFSLIYALDSNLDIASYQNLLNFEKTKYDYFEMFKLISTLKFIRFSEFQEFLFTYYFCWHAIFLRLKLTKIKYT